MKAYTAISQTIWNDQRFPHLPGEPQLVWFFLFTHPLGQIGIFKASLAGLFDEINVNGWWTRDRFEAAVGALEKANMLVVDRKMLLVAFPKYFAQSNGQNFPHNHNQLMHVLRQFEALPECKLVEDIANIFIAILQVKANRFIKSAHKQFDKLLHDCIFNCSDNGSANSSQNGLHKTLLNSRANGSYIGIGILNLILRGLESKKFEDSTAFKPWPIDLELNEKLIAIGKGFKINPHAEFQKAKDWCLSRNRSYADYEAFLRNWFRRAAEVKRS